MRVLVTGASGLIGGALVPSLIASGHEVVRAVRGRAPRPGEARWDPASGGLDSGGRLDAVIHLAAESLAGGRWTPRRKARAWRSRVESTRALCEELARDRPPRVLLAASAIGFYGDRGEEPLDESSAPGAGFLADLVRAWEGACEPAARAGVRVVNLRLGLVLARQGGALAPMLPLFRLGLGGRLGSGRQFWSWVAIQDVVGAFDHALERETLCGPLNVVAPAPVPQREFARALGRALGRPVWLPAPGPVLRLALGEMADALILASQRVLPRRLEAAGFAHRHPDLDEALRSTLAPAVDAAKARP